MAHIVRVWLVTPPAGFPHPKTEVLRMAARLRALALRARKVDAAGAMRVVARGPSEVVAAFNGDLHHKAHDGWKREELTATPEDEAELVGGGRGIVRSDDAVAGGPDSSGRAPRPVAAGDTSSVDSGSTASSRIILAEVKRERERGEAALAEAAAHEAAALETAAAAAAAREAAARENFLAVLMARLNLTRPDAEEALRGTR